MNRQESIQFAEWVRIVTVQNGTDPAYTYRHDGSLKTIEQLSEIYYSEKSAQKSTAKKLINLILRILVFPCVIGIVFIKHIYGAIRICLLFLRYGGEWVQYAKHEQNTINQIYLELKTSKSLNHDKQDIPV